MVVLGVGDHLRPAAQVDAEQAMVLSDVQAQDPGVERPGRRRVADREPAEALLPPNMTASSCDRGPAPFPAGTTGPPAGHRITAPARPGDAPPAAPGPGQRPSPEGTGRPCPPPWRHRRAITGCAPPLASGPGGPLP